MPPERSLPKGRNSFKPKRIYSCPYGYTNRSDRGAFWLRLQPAAVWSERRVGPKHTGRPTTFGCNTDPIRQAEMQAARTLEDVAVRRAHEGLRKPVWFKGKIVGYETEYSDTLLLAVLKANNPENWEKQQAESYWRLGWRGEVWKGLLASRSPFL